MPQTASIPMGGGGGIDSLPTPVKLGLLGGGLGLAFFLWKRMGSGGGGSTPSGGVSSTGQPTTDPLNATGYGIPNTAVMLGSLQQEMLDLQGTVGSSTSSLSDLVSGGFENMGSQLDAQTVAFTNGLNTLQQNVIDNQNSNTKSIMDSLSARADLLTQLINTNSGAEAAAFKAFQDATSQGLSNIAAQQNAETAAIGALGSNVTTQQKNIIDQIGALQQSTTEQYGTLWNQAASYYGNLYGAGSAQYNSIMSALKNMPIYQVQQSGGSSGGGGGGSVHQYVVNLPGGGQKTVNASSAAAAINNAGGGTIAGQNH